jgi:hypothetical protein
MEPEGMRNGWRVKVTMKMATTMIAISDCIAARNPGGCEWT